LYSACTLLTLFLGPFQLLEALSLVLIGYSFRVRRHLPPKKRKRNSHRKRERERERESSPKQGYCTVMSRSNPPTNSSLEQMAESWAHACPLCIYYFHSLSLSLSILIRVAPSYEGTNQNSTCPTNSKK